MIIFQNVQPTVLKGGEGDARSDFNKNYHFEVEYFRNELQYH